MRRWVWSHSFSLVLLAAFVVFVTGQALAGWLSIVLRQHGSPQSKPVTASHYQTGAE